MAKPSEKLAESLEKLHKLQEQGKVAIHTRELSRIHRERLVKEGFLREVMKGWYIPSRPDEDDGESTAWHASFWDFCATYLDQRFDNVWCLSPEQSISLHAENRTTPRQLLVHSPKANNNHTELLYGTSIFDNKSNSPKANDVVILNGVRLLSLPAALISCSPEFFIQNPTDVRAALSAIKDASEILPLLLVGGKSTVAGRLAGAFRNIGRDKIADTIVDTMTKTHFNVRESDPFKALPRVILSRHDLSPYANRVRIMWQQMRQQVIDVFPPAPGQPSDIQAYMDQVDGIYKTDAYHSLSIEGYRVTPELIEQVRSGNWDPVASEWDKDQRNVLAARGYYLAFKAVEKSIEQVLNNTPAGTIAEDDHGNWYRELFAPSVTAGIINIIDLAGYRNTQVYLRGSMHTPPSCSAVRDSMPVLFELLRNETEASVRVVLGHFIFVYIHPYIDGNGRIGRFLMNTMFASGGYPWVVIPVEERDRYMTALEAASTEQNIVPFAKFLTELVEKNN